MLTSAGGRRRRRFERFRTRLLDELSLEPDQLLFCLSHTHAGPPLMDPDDSLPGHELHSEWMEQLAVSAIEAIREAKTSAFFATLDWHSGRCDLATFRDFPDPHPDQDRILCGYNPDGDGWTDDTLVVGRITDSAGKIRATLVNYACHPRRRWPGRTHTFLRTTSARCARRCSKRRMPQRCSCWEPAVICRLRYQYVGDPAVADQHGRQLGFAALATLEDMEPPRDLSGMERDSRVRRSARGVET